MKRLLNTSILILILCSAVFLRADDKVYSLKEECTKNLLILADDLLKLQNTDSSSPYCGALWCEACSDFHSRASESVLPFAVAYRQSGDKKYLNAAILTGDWLVKQQLENGSWHETPDTWDGTTTDQLLAMATAYPVIKDKLSSEQSAAWLNAMKRAADWLVINMNHEYASINYCATSTATLRLVYELIPDSSYAAKAKELAMVVIPKFDEDYFLTGEGNRIRGTKYGIDLGYNMDMSLWGLGIYAKLSGDKLADKYVSESLKRCICFVYPDGSIDNSWGVRSSKWTTYGSFTADGSHILFSLYSDEEPVYMAAAIKNMNYMMTMRSNGLLTFGPNYDEMFDSPPCIYPTFTKPKSLALAILYGDDTKGELKMLPTEQIDNSKYFKTINTALVRTDNFMSTVTGYQYKDIRRGADFKYMFRPSGGSITNLWVKDYGFLQSSGQTIYHQWEMNYPELDTTLTNTPRIEFTDENAYYTNLYEFDGHMEVKENDGIFSVETIGELKDRNRWEGGVAYSLTNIIADNYIEKRIRLRFHGGKPEVKIIEPFIQKKNTVFNIIDDQTVEIADGEHKFVFKLLNKDYKIEAGTDEELYRQPFPSLKGYPLMIKVKPEGDTFIKEISYRIEIQK